MVRRIRVHPVGVAQRVALEEAAQQGVEFSGAVVVEAGGGVAVEALEEGRPAVAGVGFGGEVFVEELDAAVRRVSHAFDDAAGPAVGGWVPQGDDVELPVVESVQRLVEDAVARGVAVPADQVIDVAQAPDVLAIERRRAGGDVGDALLDALPLRGVVEVAGGGVGCGGGDHEAMISGRGWLAKGFACGT